MDRFWSLIRRVRRGQGHKDVGKPLPCSDRIVSRCPLRSLKAMKVFVARSPRWRPHSLGSRRRTSQRCRCGRQVSGEVCCEEMPTDCSSGKLRLKGAYKVPGVA